MSPEQTRAKRLPLRRPWGSIVFVVAGLALIGVSSASYSYFRNLCWTMMETENHIVWVAAYYGTLIFAHTFEPAAWKDYEKHHDFLLLRISDYVMWNPSAQNGYSAHRSYSTNAWFWSSLFLLIGVRGYIKRWVIPMRRIRRDLCAKCGYDTKGNASGVCPECGMKIGGDPR